MLQFLNNQQNKKEHPNENFAREVMELFTLGRGNYTENDVKEAARAFTGWGFNLQGEFVFREFQHDTGSKTFLGKTGNFDGDDIIDILLEQKQTANFITKKVYRFFVNDKPDSEKIAWLADRFYKSGYDIKKLMEDIFTSDWFYDDKNIGTKIKSPIELIVGIRRLLPLTLQNDAAQLLFQRALGQILFYPPNVAGWAGGTNWIDSSSLMIRLQLPRLIQDNSDFNITTKPDDDTQMGMKETSIKTTLRRMDKKNQFNIKATINWDNQLRLLASIKKEALLTAIKECLLNKNSININNDVVQKATDTTTRDTYIKTATIAIMSTPEYQLC